jgi:hypothetical protein
MTDGDFALAAAVTPDDMPFVHLSDERVTDTDHGESYTRLLHAETTTHRRPYWLTFSFW